MYGTPVTDPDNDVAGAGDGSDLISRVRSNQAGLKTLRDDHLEILDNISNPGDRDIEDRINAVTESLQMLEVGVAESGIMLSLAAHFDMMESERSITKMEMRRVKVDNECSCFDIKKIRNSYIGGNSICVSPPLLKSLIYQY